MKSYQGRWNEVLKPDSSRLIPAFPGISHRLSPSLLVCDIVVGWPGALGSVGFEFDERVDLAVAVEAGDEQFGGQVVSEQCAVGRLGQ